MKELFLNTITKPPEVIVNKFFCLCVCFFLIVFYEVRGKRLEPTQILFKWRSTFNGQNNPVYNIYSRKIIGATYIYLYRFWISRQTLRLPKIAGMHNLD